MAGTTITGSSAALLLVTGTQNPVSIAPGGYVLGSAYAIGGNTSLVWTVTNAGTLQSGGASALSDGIVLEAGGGTPSGAVIGYIDNTPSGVIHGYDAGVSIQTVGTVLNQGTITDTYGKISSRPGYSYSAGVFSPLAGAVLIGGGSVTNAASALIGSYVEAVNVGGGGTITNAGTIQATGSQGAFGVVLPAGGTVMNQFGGAISGIDGILAFAAGVRVTNASAAEIAGTSFGIDAINASATVINAGVVSSASRTAIGLGQGGMISNVSGGLIVGAKYGIFSTGPTTLTNAGTIAGTTDVGALVLGAANVSNAATGVIRGHNDAIYVGGSVASTITNSGTLLGIGTAASGVAVAAGAIVINDSAGMILGYSFGIRGIGAADTVTNAGTIISERARYGAGVGLTAGGIVTNQTSGTIAALWKGVQIGASYTTSIAGTVVNDGTIVARDTAGNGAGVWIHGAGLAVNAPGAVIAGGADGVVAYYRTTLVNQGTISGAGNAFVAVKAGFADRIVVSPGAVFQGLVNGGNTVGSAVYTTLELTTGASAGTIAGFGTQFVNIGKIELDSNAAWSLGGRVATGQIIQFDGAGSSLTLLNPALVTGSVLPTLTGFGLGDTLALAGITDVTGVTVGSGGILSVTQSAGPALNFQLNATDGQALAFATAGGATDITVACFVRGTRIATPRGAVAIERLREGDMVLTVAGASLPIQWIGRRTLDCRRHPAPDRVKPILIARHAFGHNRPKRPLRLSPDHAIFIDDLLVPAKHLVNGTTVTQTDAGTITYFHLELARHEIVLAEGLPTESYLETGGRSAFENGGAITQMHPDFAPPDEARVTMVWRNFAYAQMVGSEEQLNPVRVRLAIQAAMLGYGIEALSA